RPGSGEARPRVRHADRRLEPPLRIRQGTGRRCARADDAGEVAAGRGRAVRRAQRPPGAGAGQQAPGQRLRARPRGAGRQRRTPGSTATVRLRTRCLKRFRAGTQISWIFIWSPSDIQGCFMPVVERVFNFAAGPAVLPLSVLEEVQRDLVALPGVGMSILEISHRSKTFESILEQAEADIRTLGRIPAN